MSGLLLDLALPTEDAVTFVSAFMVETSEILHLQSQFPVRAVGFERSTRRSSTPSYMGTTSSQTVGRDVDRWVLELRFVNRYDGDSTVQEAQETLLKMSEKDPETGNYPVLQMMRGNLTAQVQIKNVGWTTSHGVDRVTGQDRTMVASVTVEEVGQTIGESIAALLGEPSTTYHEVRPTDTWASIALEHYGDPGLSVQLAQVNRARTLEPRDGEIVRVLPRDHSRMTGPAVPESVPLAVLPPQVYKQAAYDHVAAGCPGGVAWDALDPRLIADDWTS